MIKAENFFRDDLDDRPVMVSIICTVYNHAPYLRECLEGFVMQQTNFRFEAIVHDDCSTDESAEIIREYAEKYPSIIKPIYEEENQYSKDQGSVNSIMRKHKRGKYTALCEGDDYWTDPNKLQMQVDFLENNPDYSMVFHNANIINECNKVMPFSGITTRTFTSYELLTSFIVPTASIMYRENESLKQLREAFDNKQIVYGDYSLRAQCIAVGKIFAFENTMSVYRKHAGGAVFYFNPKQRDKFVDQLIYMYNFYKAYDFAPIFKEVACKELLQIQLYYLKGKKILSFICSFFKSQKISINKSCELLIKYITNK